MQRLRILVRDDKRNDFSESGKFSLFEAYDVLKADSRLDTLFYGHAYPATISDFLFYTNKHDNWIYGLYDYDSDELLCLCIINNQFGRCAMLHFCFSTFSRGIEKNIATSFFQIMRAHFSEFIGLTPKVYRHVISFAKVMGADTSVKLREACYLGKKDKYVDGVLVRYDLGGHNGKRGRTKCSTCGNTTGS